MRGLVRRRDVSCDELCLMARTFKDAWLKDKAASDLEGAKKWYEKAFASCVENRPGQATFPAVNLATLALLAGRKTEAKKWARRVLSLENKALKDPDQAAWQPPTMGEAYLVLGRISKARDQYVQLRNLDLRDRASARRQARLLLRHHGLNAHELDECFSLPRVAVFAGHMIDHPQRENPRFPKSLEKAVRRALQKRMDELNIGIGYSSAAAGADILFAELMIEREGEVQIYLSGPKDDFRERSVAFSDDDSWISRFEMVLSQSANPTDRSPEHQPSDRSLGYVFANHKLNGMAAMRARTLGLDLVALAVYDGHSGDGEGGTADFVNGWRQRIALCGGWDDDGKILIELDTLDLHQIAGRKRRDMPAYLGSNKETNRHSQRSRFQVQGMRQDIKAMLFADVQGFSRLTEDQVPIFFNRYMRTLSQLIDEASCRPVVSETWGDAVYMVFDEIEHAGNFALHMRRRLSPPPAGSLDWESLSLPPDLAIRIALHAGPVFPLIDPVMRRISFTGRHVSQAARLEPITQAGEVYATESFAALAWFDGVSDFSCEFVGAKALAKDYGEVRVFRLCSNSMVRKDG